MSADPDNALTLSANDSLLFFNDQPFTRPANKTVVLTQGVGATDPAFTVRGNDQTDLAQFKEKAAGNVVAKIDIGGLFYSGTYRFGGFDTGNIVAGGNPPAAYKGSYGTFVGRNAGQSLASGDGNTFIGNSAGYQATGGTANVFIGSTAGADARTGSRNLALGDGASPGAANGSTVAIGFKAKATADNAIMIGSLYGGSGIPVNSIANSVQLLDVTVTPPVNGLRVGNTHTLLLDTNEIAVGAQATKPALSLQAATGRTGSIQEWLDDAGTD